MPDLPPILCGGKGQPACPPEPATRQQGDTRDDDPYACYTYAEMIAHGQACYDKGRADANLEGE